MRDIHSHILPGVDDGARNLSDSLAMLEAAQSVGVTSIVCTPHCRDPYFDYDAMWAAFRTLCNHANGFPLYMGFEVNYVKLMKVGIKKAPLLKFSHSNDFLLELPVHENKQQHQDICATIARLQNMGLKVIIAHPERYRSVQKDKEVAREYLQMGCRLQCSADFISGGRLGREKKPAFELFDENLYTYIGSDAHCVEHYLMFGEVIRKYKTRGKHARA